MTTALGSAIEFLRDFGLFDVILPFLLIFAIVFALLEKTKVLGTEGKDKVPRRSLNTLVALVIGLLVVATDKAVSTLNEALPHIALILVGLVSFLLLVGSMYKEGDFDFSKHKKWMIFFFFFLFIIVLLIFASALKTSDGKSWLEFAIDGIVSTGSGSGAVGATIVFAIVAILAVLYVTKSSDSKSEEEE